MRTWGVEIEYGHSGYGGGIQQTIDNLRDANLTTITSQAGYTQSSATDWLVKTDASVRGGEMVSPPLNFDDPASREQLKLAVAALRKTGATPVPSAGIHVHIGCADLEPKQVAAVALNFIKFEDVLYRLASSGWQTIRPGATTYCKPLSMATRLAMPRVKNLLQLEKAYFGRSLQGRPVSHGDAARYYGLNLQSWFYRQTIEFRIFNSSLNADRIWAYVAIATALVQDARNGNKRSIARPFELGGMLSGVTDPKAAYHRFQQVVRYSGDMNLEDYKLMNRCWKDSRPQAWINYY